MVRDTGTVVYTAGVFDLFHVGHLNILRASKALGDVLVVGVVSDKGAAEYKRMPFVPEQERLEIVSALECVDVVMLQETTDPTPNLEIIRPDVFTHGDDWKRLLKGQETIERLGIEFRLLPYTKTVSTSELIRKIRETEVQNLAKRDIIQAT